ncbi:MAG: hypothetical protein AAB268_00530 [Elusimicrobiota bacterium]
MPKTIWVKRNDAFASKYLKTTELLDTRLYTLELMDLIGTTAELLMLADKVSFRVYGENVVAAQLIKVFGIRGFESLLEQGAIEFVLWRPTVTYYDNDAFRGKGILPLQAGALSSPAHCDPAESARLGLNWFPGLLSDAERSSLSKKISDRTILPSDKLSHRVVGLVHEMYKQHVLDVFGLDGKTLEDLPIEDRRKLCGLASDTLEAEVAATHGYDFLNDERPWMVCQAIVVSEPRESALRDAFNRIAEIERVPSLKNAFLKNTLSFSALPDLRTRESSVRLREWLWNVTQTGRAEDITKVYLDALQKPEGFFETTGFKLMKIAIGSAVGAAVTGGPGIAVGAGLAMFDEFGLKKLAQGWTPRNFIDSTLRNT